MNRKALAFEYVVVAVILLLLAGGVLFGIMPRLGRAPGIVERFLPEKCEQTGKTRDEYKSMIASAVGRPTGADEATARKIYLEMQTCFVDADIPDEQKAVIFTSTKEKLRRLANSASYKTFAEVGQIYDESRALFPIDAWSMDELLVFARALYHLGRSSEALPIVNHLLSFGLEPVQTAEALMIKDVISSITIKDGVIEVMPVTAGASKITKDFGSSSDPDVLLYVGLSWRSLQDREKAIEALDKARASTNAYTKHLATYWLAFEYLRKAKDFEEQGKTAEAEQSLRSSAVLFEEIITSQQGTVYYSQALADYSLIDESLRKFKNCALSSTGLTESCLCVSSQGAVFSSLEKCVCSTSTACKDYDGNELLCTSDPCGFGSEAWKFCVWNEQTNVCEAYK